MGSNYAHFLLILETEPAVEFRSARRLSAPIFSGNHRRETVPRYLETYPGGFQIGASTSEMAVLGHIRPRFSTVMYHCILGSARGRSERTLGRCVF